MEIVSKKKLPCLVLTLSLFVIVTFLLFYHPFDPQEGIYQTRILKEKSAYESRNVDKVVKRAAKEDRTVILTIVNQEWAKPGSVLDLFLESFQIGHGTKEFLNHLVIAAPDFQAFKYCQSIHPHCFDYSTSRTKLSVENQLSSHDSITIAQKKVYLLYDLIRSGYNFVFTEADVMWFRNPFPHFDPYVMTIASDFYSGNLQKEIRRPDGGFFYAISNEITMEVFKYWKLDMVLHPNTRDGFAETISHDFPTVVLQGKYLDTAYFGRLCQDNISMSQVHTLHGNCCSDTESKVDDLRVLLDHWRNFTVHPHGNISLGESSSWRSRLKCRR